MLRNQLLLILAGFLVLSSCGKEVTYVCLEDDPPIAECCADDPTLSYCQSTGDMGTDGLNNPVDMAEDQDPNNPPDADNNQPDADEDMPDPDMAPACVEACEGDTPVCDEASGNCVECTQSSQCADGVCHDFQCVQCLANADCDSGACDVSSNTCVQCVSNLNCIGGQVCDTDNFACVDCLDTTDCTGELLCKVETASADNTCVACLGNADCDTADASRCGAANTCQSCQAAADCTHIAGAKQCEAGACVECTPATQAADCDNKVCDPDNFTCTGIDIGSAIARELCEFDAQCLSNHACVPLNYMSVFHGNYCMPRFVVGSPCEKPYGAGGLARTSVNGQNSSLFCMINEELTTPEAIRDYNSQTCTTDIDCTSVGAVCAVRNPSSGDPTQICTYRCNGNNDCKTGSNCVGADPSYCGVQ